MSPAGSGWEQADVEAVVYPRGARAALLVSLASGERDGQLTSSSSSALNGPGGAACVPGRWLAGWRQTDVEVRVTPLGSLAGGEWAS